MIVSKVDHTQHGVSKYIITQGIIDWSNDNWYKDPSNALWLKLVMNAVKDWLSCRRAMKLSKESSGFHFYNMVSELVKTIDLGFNSELKMSIVKTVNISQSRKNKTNIILASKLLFGVVDGITVTSRFFENQDFGTYATLILRESDHIQHQHQTFIHRLLLSDSNRSRLLKYRFDCDASEIACRNLIAQMRQESSQP